MKSAAVVSFLALLAAKLSSMALDAPVTLEPGSLETPGPALESYIATFRWAPVSGATGYRFAIRDLDKQTERPSRVFPASTNSFELPLISGHSYGWNVRALNGTNESSPSATRFFRIALSRVRPSITGVLPNPVPALNGAQAFIVNGNDFRPGCAVVLRDKRTNERFEFESLKIHYRRNDQLFVSPNFTAAEHPWTVEIINVGGEASGEFPFAIVGQSKMWWRNWWSSHQPWMYGSLLTVCALTLSWRRQFGRMRKDERARLLRDLHDHASADVAHLKQLAGLTATESAALPEDTQTLVRDLSWAARDAETAIDDLVWAADPQNENLMQLGARLRVRIRERLKAHNVEADFSGWPVPLPDVCIRAKLSREALYLCHEAVNNVIKHARATKVICRLAASNGSLVLEFEDNGRGFDKDSIPSNCRGLRNMEIRARGVGGLVSWSSRPGEGTRTRISLPLKGRIRLIRLFRRKANLPLRGG